MDTNLIKEQLDRIENNSLSQKSILNLDELVKYTGFKKKYIYSLTSRDLIPHSKPLGKVLFFDREKIDEFLLSNSRKSKQELKAEAISYVLQKK
ncbi:helix-turn-helix transcriptional regulator [Nonlabens sp. Asnod3-A02]|uniref:helix-turn-helix transcriptional regulator n=1 Tax=Nonlabens sp. Asnod3-A02 TaxID=3160579 RepID=UPI00386A4D5F